MHRINAKYKENSLTQAMWKQKLQRDTWLQFHFTTCSHERESSYFSFFSLFIIDGEIEFLDKNKKARTELIWLFLKG